MTLNWTGLYSERWSDLVHPSAVSHPAKFNHGLIRKIYDYAIEQGYIHPGGSVADPFGGVGLGSFYAAMNGITWTGCELEPLFVTAGYRNFEKWIDKFWCACGWEDYLSTLRNWLITSKDEPKPVDDTLQVSMFDLIEPPQLDSAALWAKLLELVQLQRVEAVDRRSIEGQFCVGCGKVIAPYPVLLQGDSRFLSSILGQVGAVVSSPPYIDTDVGGRGGEGPGAAGNAARRSRIKAGSPNERAAKAIGVGYHDTEGQLGALPSGDFDMTISSPSWAGNSGGQGDASRNAIDPGLFDRHQGGMKRGTGDGEPGNIDHMSEGEYSAVVSSPPYENTNMDMSNGLVGTNVNNGQYGQSTYGQTEGQLGGKQNNPITFWAASKDILLETHKVLRKGGYTFWVVKRYIKAGKVIDFPDMWKRLCEVCGFEHVETIHAWQTEDKGTNFDFEGEKQTRTIKRASFFRLLYEKKYPENSIDFEVVLVLRKL